MQPRFSRSSSTQQGLTGVECPTIFHTQASEITKSDGNGNSNEMATSQLLISARVIDETCRFAFPFAFFLFNCIYWPYYLYHP